MLKKTEVPAVLFTACLSFTVILLSQTFASAALYYVSPSGNDFSAGTEQLPFRTLNAAVVKLKPGDTLNIMKGTYAESLKAGVIPGGTPTAPVTLQAYPDGALVTIKPAVTTPKAEFVLLFAGAAQHDIVIKGLDLDGTNVVHDVIKITYGATTADSAHNITIRNCDVHGAPGQGILTSGQANGNIFSYLHLYDNGPWASAAAATTNLCHGIYISTSNNIVEFSESNHNTGYGIQVYCSAGEGTASGNIIRGNFIHDNGTNNAGGLVLSSGSKNVAYNNQIFNSYYGVKVDYGAVDTMVYNNSSTNNKAYGVYVGSNSKGAVIKNNNVSGNAWGDVINRGTP